ASRSQRECCRHAPIKSHCFRRERFSIPGSRDAAAQSRMNVMSRKHNDNRGVYLVQPRFPPTIWGMEHLLRLTHYQATLPPLGLLTLAALAPEEFHVTVCDENAGERVDYDTPAQIVGITGYLLQMTTAF